MRKSPNDAQGGSGEVTALLEAVARGEEAALTALFDCVYKEVHAQASAELSRLPRSGTLNTTAAVHEAYVRLFGRARGDVLSRKQFYFATARAIRDVLIEHLRAKRTDKRGGAWQKVSFESADLGSEEREETVLFVNEALAELKQEDPQCAEVVLLRFFGGLTYEDISEALSLSVSQVRREWAFAQDWLARRLS